MALIQNPIPTQRFEQIRTRLGEILATELPNQATLNSDPNLDATVWEERFTNFANDEMPAVNVTFDSGNLHEYSQLKQRYDYLFFIDVHLKAKADATQYGDLKSRQKLHRLNGVIRSILADTHYKTLGFTAGFIAQHRLESIQIVNQYDGDGNFISMSRISYTVRAMEDNGFETPRNAEGYDTRVELEETDKGYKYTYNN